MTIALTLAGLLGDRVAVLDFLLVPFVIAVVIGALLTFYWFFSVPFAAAALLLVVVRASIGRSHRLERAALVLNAAILMVYLPGAFGIAAERFSPFCLD